ncbi:hypothetical protein, partial [Aminicella lysinilytica]|uniref:hypothetical protein n=1 Tax=Aminicella lysinilytica TaxID=433323 RepID=UPI001A9A968E
SSWHSILLLIFDIVLPMEKFLKTIVRFIYYIYSSPQITLEFLDIPQFWPPNYFGETPNNFGYPPPRKAAPR